MDAAIVEDVPGEPGADAAREGLFLKEIGEVLGGGADRAVDGDMRIKLGFGNADLGALGGCLPLGAADIGPAAEQVCRDADGYFRGRGGDRP